MLRQCCLDVGRQRGGFVSRRVTIDDLAVAAHQEFGEVPLDAVEPKQAALLVLQPLPQRMCVAAIDLDLGEHRKAHVIGQRTEIADFVCIAWFLMAELVTGKTQHHQSLLAVFAPQCLQPGVLRGEPAFAGHVDDQQDIAAIVGQWLRRAVQGSSIEIIGGRGHRASFAVQSDLHCGAYPLLPTPYAFISGVWPGNPAVRHAPVPRSCATLVSCIASP